MHCSFHAHESLQGAHSMLSAPQRVMAWAVLELLLRVPGPLFGLGKLRMQLKWCRTMQEICRTSFLSQDDKSCCTQNVVNMLECMCLLPQMMK